VRGESDGVADTRPEHPVALVRSPCVAQDSVASRNACMSLGIGSVCEVWFDIAGSAGKGVHASGISRRVARVD
jgi:hypothetical protein